MAIKTRKQELTEYNRKQHICFECGKDANYWSQDEQPDGHKQGTIVWHCQLHRALGQLMAKIHGPK